MFTGNAYGFSGLRLIGDRDMADRVIDYVPRGWRERLFSRPWRPWRRLRVVITYVPQRRYIRIGDMVIMHPALIEEIKQALAARDGGGFGAEGPN